MAAQELRQGQKLTADRFAALTTRARDVMADLVDHVPGPDVTGEDRRSRAEDFLEGLRRMDVLIDQGRRRVLLGARGLGYPSALAVAVLKRINELREGGKSVYCCYGDISEDTFWR